RMERFECSGWLNIAVTEQSTTIDIKIKHIHCHPAYLDISLPDHWKVYIEENFRKQTPGQVRKAHFSRQARLDFRSKSVYYYWHCVSRHAWKLAEDPVDSAEEFICQKGKEHNVGLLNVEAVPGVRVLAFQVTDFIKEWARNTQELAMDSTFGTNGANFELFSAVGGAAGSGIPLAFCYIQTSNEAAPGAKEAVLTSFLYKLKKLGVNPEYTLTDKDWSEINAMHKVWPLAKHQLCFWHALRALKQRLSKNKEVPSLYNVEAARREFTYIKTSFVPVMQQNPINPSIPTKSPSYVFCPAPHRISILRLFAKHASQHTLLPKRHGQPRSAADIRRDAVFEMYRHCERNRLCEVWAYLWNNWYSHDKWQIWARSANPRSIPCHRTTMIVEALWRNLKRLVLHMFNRPSLDLANFMIITKTIPNYRSTLDTLLTFRGGGRPKSLTQMQKAFKASWERLQSSPIKGKYITDITQWTCDCGAQKYHAYLLCKHLVQAVGPVAPEWWLSATRYHIPPFYTLDASAKKPEQQRNYDWLARMGMEIGDSDDEVEGALQNSSPVSHHQSYSILVI
ncbi:hypothetical protein BDW22DRAFT_1337423, partial [Trametopsis cervina]